jgi:hypothetical protein
MLHVNMDGPRAAGLSSVSRVALLGLVAGASLLSSAAFAQNRGAEIVPDEKARITGTLTVDFGSRLASGATGVDTYTFDKIAVADLLLLSGTVQRTPEKSLSYSEKFDVINPQNPTQVADGVAILRGDVTIDDAGKYVFTDSNLRIDIVKGTQSSSKFNGTLQGREVTRWWEITEQYKRAESEATKLYSRYVDGKTVTIQVKNPDPLGFQGVVLAAGPFTYLPETTVNGNLDYDYELGNWLTDNNGLTLSYSLGSGTVTDKITGSIRYVEAEGTATTSNGAAVPYTGYYDYTLRFNEQANVNQDQAFFDGSNEQAELDAFFSTTDTSKPGIYGRVYFQDSEDNCKMVKGQDGKEACVGPTKSVITYDLKATGLNYAQLAAWQKIEQIVVGPFTDE